MPFCEPRQPPSRPAAEPPAGPAHASPPRSARRRPSRLPRRTRSRRTRGSNRRIRKRPHERAVRTNIGGRWLGGSLRARDDLLADGAIADQACHDASEAQSSIRDLENVCSTLRLLSSRAVGGAEAQVGHLAISSAVRRHPIEADHVDVGSVMELEPDLRTRGDDASRREARTAPPITSTMPTAEVPRILSSRKIAPRIIATTGIR
jgi:hypothetical protein